MKRAEITCEGVMCFNDGRRVPLEKATKEERALFIRNQCDRNSRDMSEYYSLHLEQYALLLEELEEKEKKRHDDVSQSGGNAPIPA